MGSSSSGVVFDIQRFSIHDGPGIRTTVFLKGCPLRCAWCQNPESHRPQPELAFYAERCQGCFACREVCPRGAIAGTPGRRVDHERCDACGACAGICPTRSLRLIGATWEVERLATELARDKDYFADSGGGVTFSGGEPMLQPGFVLELARLLHGAGIPVNVETCGTFRWADMQETLPDIDLVYFDLKLMDGNRHREWTGADNRLILENVTLLSQRFRNLQVRMPVIPGVNDDEENLRAIARFLLNLGLKSIHCLPYNALGQAKIGRLNTSQKPLRITADAGASAVAAANILGQEGIHAIVYD